jgi:hypothetical protein
MFSRFKFIITDISCFMTYRHSTLQAGIVLYLTLHEAVMIYKGLALVVIWFIIKYLCVYQVSRRSLD